MIDMLHETIRKNHNDWYAELLEPQWLICWIRQYETIIWKNPNELWWLDDNLKEGGENHNDRYAGST